MPSLELFFSLTPFRRHLLLTLGNGSEKWLSCPWAYTGRLNFFCFTCAIARPLSPRAGSLTIRRVCFLLYSYYPTVSMADPDARWHQSCMHACARPIPTALWLLPASCTKLYVLRWLDQNCTYVQYSSNCTVLRLAWRLHFSFCTCLVGVLAFPTWKIFPRTRSPGD